MIERRILSKSAIRTAAGDKRTIEGHAATFGTLSSDLGGFREKIAHGTFSKTIGRGDDIKALINHSPNLLIGRTRNSTLQLNEDFVGLAFRCMVARTSYGDDLLANIDAGNIDEMSFGFVVDPDGDSWEDGYDPDDGSRCAIRTLRSVKLTDVSVVVFPAYDGTTVDQAARSLPDSIPCEIRSRILAAGPLTTHNARSRRLHSFILS